MKSSESIKTCIDVIKELVPLISVVVVGLTACLAPILTGRANRKLTRETNAYLQKKEALDDFSNACTKYWGIITTYLSTLLRGNIEYSEGVIRSLTEAKWVILKIVEPSIYDDVNDHLMNVEGIVYETIRICYSLREHKDATASEIAKAIDEGSQKIVDATAPLQELLIQQHRTLRSALPSR